MLFSVIITTYNAENFLEDALNSLKNQTFQDFEIIVTDDGSTDLSLDVCKRWLTLNPEFQTRIKIIANSVNTRVSANVNRGLKKAFGEWIYILSADDALNENALECVANAFKENTEISVIQGIADVYNEDFSAENFNKQISENQAVSDFFKLSAKQQYLRLLKKCNVVSPAVFFKKTVAEEIGFCDERIPDIDDWPLWINLTKNGHKFYFLDVALIKYRIHEQSITNENKGVFVTSLHRKERLVYKFYILPNVGFSKKICIHLRYFFNEFLYRFFNSKENPLVCGMYVFLKSAKRLKKPFNSSKDPLHIAFFMQDFMMGGVGIVFLNYIKLLKPIGYKIDVITARDIGTLRERFAEYAQLINLGNIRQRWSIFRLRKQIRTSSVSTLISGSELANFTAILALFGKKKSCQLIITQHGIFNQDDLDIGKKSCFVNLAKRILYRHASKIIAVSKAVSDELKTLRLPEKKITIVPNPVFKEEIMELSNMPFSTEIPEKYILFIGRLVTVKNVELLIDSFPYISNTATHLLIVGEGYNRRALEEKAKSISSRIHFLGIVDNPMPLIKQASVVAIPSFSESVSLVALESCILGTTVVHTPNSGCIDVLGEAGYCTTSFDNPKEFATALQSALDHPVEEHVLQARVPLFDVNWLINQINPR